MKKIFAILSFGFLLIYPNVYAESIDVKKVTYQYSYNAGKDGQICYILYVDGKAKDLSCWKK